MDEFRVLDLIEDHFAPKSADEIAKMAIFNPAPVARISYYEMLYKIRKTKQTQEQNTQEKDTLEDFEMDKMPEFDPTASLVSHSKYIKLNPVIQHIQGQSTQEKVLNLIYSLFGIVFAGFLRDTMAGVQPNDIDAVVPIYYSGRVVRSMIELGYTLVEKQEIGIALRFVKEGELNVEISYSEAVPGLTRIKPSAEPDFDVSLLAYNGREMYNWMPGEPDSELDVLSIIGRIQRRQTIQFAGAEPHRIKKMQDKGYTIIKIK